MPVPRGARFVTGNPSLLPWRSWDVPVGTRVLARQRALTVRVNSPLVEFAGVSWTITVVLPCLDERSSNYPSPEAKVGGLARISWFKE